MPSQQSQPANVAPPPVPQGSGKDPIVAAILNLLLGLGYLYLGFRKVLGLPTILFIVVYLLVDIVLGILTFWVGPLILAILVAYDGYVKAKGEKGYLITEPALLYQ
jgi:hypothetical protein